MTLQQNIANQRTLTIGAVQPLNVVASPTLVSGAAFTTTVAGVEDSMLEQSTSAASWNEFGFSAPLNETVTYESLTPSCGTIEDGRLVRAGSGGMVSVKATSAGRSKVIHCNTGSTSAVTTRFSTYADGSDSLTLANNILSRINETSELTFFTNYTNVQTGGQTIFTKNTNCWLYGVNMSGCAIDGNIFNTYSSANKGALITSHHLLGADHWQSTFPSPGTGANSNNGLRVGQTFRFRGEDGTVHSRQIIGVGRGYGDCVVATLATGLPASVTPFKLAGDWHARNPTATNSSQNSYWNGGAVFYLDQEYKARFMLGATKARVSASNYGPTYPNSSSQSIFNTPSQDSALTGAALVSGKTAFFREGIVGDSGSGIFYLVGGEAILVGTFYYPNWCHAVGIANGVLANEMIAAADADAIARGSLVSPTGLTVTVAADPTL